MAADHAATCDINQPVLVSGSVRAAKGRKLADNLLD